MSGNSGRCCGYCGVTVLMARTDGTPSTEPRCFSANDLLATISAAAPSDVAQISSSRSGSDTTGLASTSSTEALLAVPGVRIVQAVLGVLDLHRSEVLERGAVEVHPPPRQQREVHRVRRADQVEALPVRVVLPFAADRGEEALRRGVGTDDQRDVAEAGEDLRPGALQRLRSAGARRVARADRNAVPAQLLGERRAGDEARDSRCGWCRRRRPAGSGASPGPASASAARAATTPYSVKSLPHLPHGCMPAPRM